MYRTSRTLITGALCMMAVLPVFADPPAREMAQELGYSELIKQIDLPTKHHPRAPLGKRRGGLEPVTASRISADRKLLDAYMYQKAESASMIPFLLTLQKKQPESAKISRKLALTCLEAGQPREALYWFSYTYQRDRTDLPALWNMAALAYRLGDTRKTNDYLDEYARRDPNSMWGMVAKKFRETGTFGGYNSGTTMSEYGMPRIGFVSAGAAGAPEGGMMVVEGKRTSAEEILPEANQLPDVNPFKPSLERHGAKLPEKTTVSRRDVTAEPEKIPTPLPGTSLVKAEIQTIPAPSAAATASTPIATSSAQAAPSSAVASGAPGTGQVVASGPTPSSQN